MSTASHETALPVAGIPSRSPCWVALTTRRMTTRSSLATRSCSTATRSGSAPIKVRSMAVTFSAPLIFPSEPPCQVICGVKYSIARSGWWSLKTRARNSRATATFPSMLDASLTSFPFRGSDWRLDECVESPDLSVGENRDVHAAQDWRNSGRAGLPAQAAEVVNHLCSADQTEREARRALVEDKPDPIRDGCLADALSLRVVERAILGIQFGDCAPAQAGVPLAEDLGHISLHNCSEGGRGGAHAGTVADLTSRSNP